MKYFYSMKHFYLVCILWLASYSTFGQLYGNYYNSITANDSGLVLRNKLVNLIVSTHTTSLSYTPGVWNALKVADLDLDQNGKVVLVYGYDDASSNVRYHRTRSASNNGGGTGQWNREHVYPKSKGQPDLGESGPGSDAHHLRPADVQFNADRGNRPFNNNTGNAGVNPDGTWYPGDEWKGDVARMMMYMYLRYGERCLPTRVGPDTVTISQIDQMIDLFIQWHIEDPVSPLEIQRNHEIYLRQGNRNPFIDQPNFVNRMWGTTPPTDPGEDNEEPGNPTTSITQNQVTSFVVSPNPTSGYVVIQANGSETFQYTITDALGRQIGQGNHTHPQIDLTNQSPGAYFISIQGSKTVKTYRVIRR